MSLFGLFKKTKPVAATGSESFQAFYCDYIAAPGRDAIRNGLDEAVFAKLTPSELAEAERLLMERLAAPGDSRAAVGLGVIGAKQAVAPLRRLAAVQKNASFASVAYAQALWRIARDPAAIEAVVALAQAKQLNNTHRMDAVRALAEMPAEQTRQVLLGLLQSEPDYLLRYHSFNALLMLSGLPWAKANEQAGAMAPMLARMLADANARDAVMAKLAELSAPPAAG
ncbi:MAG: HEAT repeat domain-containing protein [Burkholderiales bacterium]